MELIDLFVAPIYLTFIYFVAYLIKYLKRNDPLVQKYFIPALHVRIIGSIVLGLIYFFHYKGGDTIAYHRDGLIIMEGLFNDTITMIRILFVYDITDPDIYPYTYRFSYYNDPHAFFVSKTVGILTPFTFGIYTVIGFFFAIISLSGSWALFTILCRVAPQMEKRNAIAALFLPSIFFWGSGILKDTLTFSAMGWFVFAVHEYFFIGKKKTRAIILIVLASYVMYNVKEYVLMSIFPACSIWVVLEKLKNLKSASTRAFLKPVLFSLAIIVGVGGSTFLLSDQSKYKLDNIVQTSSNSAMYLRRVSNEVKGSTYDLGDFDPSLAGMSKLILPAINVALFRPYPWEIKNILMLLSSIESMAFLAVTLLLLYRVKIKTIVQIINNNSFLICALVFSLVFSMAVGISSYNFGTLVRYKIPMLPFYTFLLFYIYEEGYVKPKKRHERKRIY